MNTSKSQLLDWEIVGPSDGSPSPKRLITLHPPSAVNSIPYEIALLLPINDGNRILLQAIAEQPMTPDCALGLFLVDPFLNMATLSDRLKTQGVRWVTNFPSVAQHDPTFGSYLNDVDLGLRFELDRLKTFKSHGFKTLAVMCQSRDASEIADCDPDMVVHIPGVASFLSGIPDSKQLAAKELAMKDALRDHQWTGPLLGYHVSHTRPKGPALLRP